MSLTDRLCPFEIRRVIHVEPLINHIQIGFVVPIVGKPAGVDRVVAAALGVTPLLCK